MSATPTPLGPMAGALATTTAEGDGTAPRRRHSPYRARFKEEIIRCMVMHPSWGDARVAAEFGVHRTTVSKIRRKFEVRVDYKLAQNLAGKFLAEFTQASDYFKGKIDEAERSIEALRDRLDADGTLPPKERMSAGDAVSLHMAMDRLRRTQLDLWKAVLESAGQGGMVEGLRVLRDADIPQAGGPA